MRRRTEFFGFMAALLALGLMVFTLSASAQSYSVTNLDLDLIQNARSVIREEMTEIEVKSESEARLKKRKVVTILNDKSDEGDIFIPYDSENKLHSLKAWIYDAKGELVRKRSKDEIQDYSMSGDLGEYDDSRVKIIELNYSSYPFTIEVEYEQTVKGIYFASFPDWAIQGWRESVQQSGYRVIAPASFKIHYQNLNGDFQPKITSDGKDKVYSWEVRSLPAIKPEPLCPPSSQILPRVKITPANFEIEGYAGKFDSWESYGLFMNRLFDENAKLPQHLRTEIQNIIADAPDTRTKINRLYRYMQQNMRYVSVQFGIGGWKPFDPAYVQEKKYGDCKALTNYMRCLLREAEIESFPVLIKSGRLNYEVSDSFATSDFNHVVLYVPEEDYWLECTSNSLPANYIGSGNLDRNVLLFGPDGGRVIRTPKLSPEENLEANRIVINLHEDGSANLDVTGTKHGVYHERLRYLSGQSSPKEQKEWILENSSLPTFYVDEFSMDASSDAPEASIQYKASVPRYARRMGKRLFVSLNQVTTVQWVPDEAKDRKYPLVRKDGYVEVDTFELNLPKDFRVESLKREGTKVESDFGNFEIQFLEATTPNKLMFIRRFEVLPFNLPPERYSDYRDFYLQVSKLDGMKLVLVEQKT